MTAKDVWDTVNEVDGQDIGKGTRIVLEALVKDGEEMGKRITSIEGKVDKLCGDMEELKGLIQQNIDKKQDFWKLMSELIKEPKFWIWIIILTVLFFGVSITDIKDLISK